MNKKTILLHQANALYNNCVDIIPLTIYRTMLALLMLLCGQTLAAEESRSNGLAAVYNHAGVHTHLSWVHSTVTDETQIAWQDCQGDQNHAEIETVLKESLSIDALQQGFLEELNQRINDDQLAQINDWIKSDAGKNIHQAELDSINLDESKFESLLEDYMQSEVHGDARNTRLKNMLADTGAVYFLSALNTELSALVSIASICSNSEADLAAAQKQVREDRASEALYRSFMRQELIKPSAVIYQNISDADLDALGLFAKSDAGNAYYTALIKGTRSLLKSKVDRLSKVLETMPK